MPIELIYKGSGTAPVKSVNGKTGNVILNAADVGAATEDYVDKAIESIEIPEVDLEGYATKEFVNNAIEDIEIPEADLTDYALKEDTYTKKDIDNKLEDYVEDVAELIGGGA